MTANPKYLRPEQLDDWLAAALAALNLTDEKIPIGTVLDVARDVAHDVARPAAPLSTFLLGLAVGRASTDGHAGSNDPALAEYARVLTERAAQWAQETDESLV